MIRMKKICLVCKTEFETQFSNALYCGDVCRVRARREQMRQVQKKRYDKQMATFRKMT